MRQQVWISTNEKKVSSSSHTQAHKHTQYTHMNARIDRMWAVCCCTDAYVCASVNVHAQRDVENKDEHCVHISLHPQQESLASLRAHSIYIRYISNGIAIISLPFDSLFAFSLCSQHVWNHLHCDQALASRATLTAEQPSPEWIKERSIFECNKEPPRMLKSHAT